jgi:hypothetical protein
VARTTTVTSSNTCSTISGPLRVRHTPPRPTRSSPGGRSFPDCWADLIPALDQQPGDLTVTKHARSASPASASPINSGRAASNVVGVRDTKDNGGGPIPAFTREEWATAVSGTTAGEFDLY